MTLRADLEAAFKSQAALDAGLIYTYSQNTQVYSKREGRTEKDFPVFIMWGGRSPAGVRTRFLRTVWRVIVVLGPMQTDDPWARADEGTDAALEIIYSVPGTFPELLPITSLILDPAGTGFAHVKSGAKTYACAVIQVVGG